MIQGLSIASKLNVMLSVCVVSISDEVAHVMGYFVLIIF